MLEHIVVTQLWLHSVYIKTYNAQGHRSVKHSWLQNLTVEHEQLRINKIMDMIAMNNHRVGIEYIKPNQLIISQVKNTYRIFSVVRQLAVWLHDSNSTTMIIPRPRKFYRARAFNMIDLKRVTVCDRLKREQLQHDSKANPYTSPKRIEFASRISMGLECSLQN